MTTRERTVTHVCAEPGCHETRFFIYTSQREYKEIYADQQRRPFRCSRHEHPEQVLRPDNPQRSTVLVAARSPRTSGLYWTPEGGRPGSGFCFGPGFKAHAVDFPEGTRLVIEARIEPPTDAGSCIEIQPGGLTGAGQ
jgi:hypothetical protein